MPAKKPMTPQAVQRLPWPQALKNGEPLTVKECYKVGELIIKRLRGGDDRRGKGFGKSWPVREVAEVLGASHSTIGRCVQVYCTVEKFGLKTKIEQLTQTLLVNVERLPEKRQKAFIGQALSKGWNRNEIIAKAAGMDPREMKSRGTRESPAKPELVQKLREMNEFGLSARGAGAWEAKHRKQALVATTRLLAKLKKVEVALAAANK